MNTGEKIAGALGQSSARWQILGRAAPPPQTVSQIAREMGMARQSVQRVVNALKRDGLIALEMIPTDKRTSFVTLTPSGAQVLAAIYQRNAEWATRISRRIPAREFGKATELLDHIGAILEEDLNG